MKKIKLVGVTLALFCTLSMAACGSTQNGQETQSEPPAYSQGEMSGGNKDADAGKGKEELPGNLGDIEAEAILGGSVAEFQDGSFQVIPMETDAETTKLAASGMESTLESTTVSYGDDCTFHIANINRTTGAVEFEAAVSSVGVVDAVGRVWEWLDELITRAEHATNADYHVSVAWGWDKKSPLNTGEKSYDVGNIYQYYAYSLAALFAGGYWGDGAYCGARAVNCSIYPWYVNTLIGARGACDSL